MGACECICILMGACVTDFDTLGGVLMMEFSVSRDTSANSSRE